MIYRFTIGKFPNGQGLDKALDRLEIPLRKEAQLQVARLKGAFRVGGHQDHGGERWAPLAPSTIKRKEKMGKTNILIVTGELMRSIHGGVRVMSKGKFKIVTGTNDPKAPWHQNGTESKSMTMAASQRITRHARGKMVVNKKGIAKWKKGALLRDEAGNLAPKISKVKAHERKVGGMPARKVIVTTTKDEGSFGARVSTVLHEAINGNVPLKIKGKKR